MPNARSAGLCRRVPPWRIIEYLGRYTHKVAISNHRIAHVDNDQVAFRYKDYKTGDNGKTMQLNHDEFVRRFAQHILPHRFVRIRHYGILSASWKRGRLQALQASLHMAKKEVPVTTLLRKCPCCKTGKLITIEVFGKRGPPQKYFMESKPVPVS